MEADGEASQRVRRCTLDICTLLPPIVPEYSDDIYTDESILSSPHRKVYIQNYKYTINLYGQNIHVRWFLL